MIAVDLSKKQAPDADPKATQKLSLTGHLDRAEGAKETVLDFSQGAVKVS